MLKKLLAIMSMLVFGSMEHLKAAEPVQEDSFIHAKDTCEKIWQLFLTQKNIAAPDHQSAPEDIADYNAGYQSFMVNCIKNYNRLK